jgi:hypothetical protein
VQPDSQREGFSFKGIVAAGKPAGAILLMQRL